MRAKLMDGETDRLSLGISAGCIGCTVKEKQEMKG
jgi:hypothetical protein